MTFKALQRDRSGNPAAESKRINGGDEVGNASVKTVFPAHVLGYSQGSGTAVLRVSTRLLHHFPQ